MTDVSGDGVRRAQLRRRRAPQDRQLVERLRDRLGGHDPRHRNRADDGHLARRGGDSDHVPGHAQRLAAVSVPGRARRDDARSLGRLAHVRLRRLQGPLADVRRARQRDHRLGLLARLVPGGAAEHDPGVVLHRGAVQAEHHERDQPARDEHRLVDDRDLGDRDPAPVHSLLPRSALRNVLCDRARPAVDDPADVPGDLVDLPPVGRRLRPAHPFPAHRTAAASSPERSATAG